MVSEGKRQKGTTMFNYFEYLLADADKKAEMATAAFKDNVSDLYNEGKLNKNTADKLLELGKSEEARMFVFELFNNGDINKNVADSILMYEYL